MQFSGLTMDKLKDQMKPDALNRIKSSLVLEQIVAEENIEASEEDLNAEIDKMAEAYRMTADKIKEMMGDAEKKSMKKDIAMQKAVEFVMDNIKERAKPKSKKEEAE